MWFRAAAVCGRDFKVNVKFSGVSAKKVARSVLEGRPEGEQMLLFRPRLALPLLVLRRMCIKPSQTCPVSADELPSDRPGGGSPRDGKLCESEKRLPKSHVPYSI